MPSFASLANLVYRLQKKRRNLSKVSTNNPLAGQVQPLPRALTDCIPQELFERFIEFLHGDNISLSRCSTVCRAWLPASRYHLFSSLIVRPIQLNIGWWLRVNCSVAFRGFSLAHHCPSSPDDLLIGDRKYMLYGNKEGVYWSEPERGTPPVQVLFLPDVSQIDVLEDHNLFVCLSGESPVLVFRPPFSVRFPIRTQSHDHPPRYAEPIFAKRRQIVYPRFLSCVILQGRDTIRQDIRLHRKDIRHFPQQRIQINGTHRLSILARPLPHTIHGRQRIYLMFPSNDALRNAICQNGSHLSPSLSRRWWQGQKATASR
jgi:CNH domain